MLHIIKNFPVSPSFLDSTHSGDTIIFTENAVLAMIQNNIEKESMTQKAFNHINLCVRKADLLLKNISNHDLLRGVAVIDDLQYQNVISQQCAIRSCN
jgi:sulfur relay protein TusB/DsrH